MINYNDSCKKTRSENYSLPFNPFLLVNDQYPSTLFHHDQSDVFLIVFTTRLSSYPMELRE